MAPRGDTKARMIAAAEDLFRRRGYVATALTDVVEASGTPRGSIYFHFRGGKEELAVSVTERVGALLEETVEEAAAGAASAGDIPRRLADTFAHNMTSSGYELGCPLAPISLETAPASEVLRDACAAAFQRWSNRLAEHYTRHGVPQRRARVLAVLTISSLEGALILARVEESITPLTEAAEELAAVVAGAADESVRPDDA